jgi:5'(3')-deoxyribonucleotidase
MAEHNDKKLLQYPITFVEIIFTVVIGASILRFNELLFPPACTTLSFWALIVSYFTAITSWFGWHKSTSKYPYTDSGAGRLRSVLDAIIVAAYVALLFFGSKVDELFNLYIWGFFSVFLLYLIVGVIRCIEYHDPTASEIKKIIYHLIAMFVIAVAFTVSSTLYPQYPKVVLWIFVFLPLVIMASFRWFREWHELSWTEVRTTVAVDMDGVLVEQVAPVLAKLKREMNVDLCKCDITDWQFPIKETNIKMEIEKAERDEQFVRTMPPIKGAIEGIQKLSGKFNIVIATSRESCTDSSSRAWLDNHSVPYGRFVNTRSEGKILNGTDILIDDYIENIRQFISNGTRNRQAILFAQPWNYDTTTIADLISSGKVRIAHSWQAILAMLA